MFPFVIIFKRIFFYNQQSCINFVISQYRFWKCIIKRSYGGPDKSGRNIDSSAIRGRSENETLLYFVLSRTTTRSRNIYMKKLHHYMPGVVGNRTRVSKFSAFYINFRVDADDSDSYGQTHKIV
jgi:hypothetical protein